MPLQRTHITHSAQLLDTSAEYFAAVALGVAPPPPHTHTLTTPPHTHHQMVGGLATNAIIRFRAWQWVGTAFWSR